LSSWKPAFYTASHANLGLWIAENLLKDMHVETRNELIKMILDHETTRSILSAEESNWVCYRRYQ
jgi:hypothetical protein